MRAKYWEISRAAAEQNNQDQIVYLWNFHLLTGARSELLDFGMQVGKICRSFKFGEIDHFNTGLNKIVLITL